MQNVKLIVIAHNIRSTHNIGSLLRTSNGLGVDRLYMTGYSPYPRIKDDQRLPHVSLRAEKQIAKTSLGAELATQWEHHDDVLGLIEILRSKGYTVVALDQNKKSDALSKIKKSSKIALILGSEIGGVDSALLKQADQIVEIPMLGSKNSYNVSIAAAIALYHIRYFESS